MAIWRLIWQIKLEYRAQLCSHNRIHHPCGGIFFDLLPARDNEFININNMHVHLQGLFSNSDRKSENTFDN